MRDQRAQRVLDAGARREVGLGNGGDDGVRGGVTHEALAQPAREALRGRRVVRQVPHVFSDGRTTVLASVVMLEVEDLDGAGRVVLG